MTDSEYIMKQQHETITALRAELRAERDALTVELTAARHQNRNDKLRYANHIETLADERDALRAERDALLRQRDVDAERAEHYRDQWQDAIAENTRLNGVIKSGLYVTQASDRIAAKKLDEQAATIAEYSKELSAARQAIATLTAALRDVLPYVECELETRLDLIDGDQAQSEYAEGYADLQRARAALAGVK